MKVILVNGSPHKNGSTARALEEVEKTLIEDGIETEIFWIGNSAISGCTGCYSCAKIGKCVIDDVVNKFVEKAETADGFVFGTSVHYAAMTGAMTSFMDRVFYSAGCGGKNKIFRRKKALWVGTQQNNSESNWKLQNYRWTKRIFKNAQGEINYPKCKRTDESD